MFLLRHDFSEGWKPYEYVGDSLPSDIPEDVRETMASTTVDGKKVFLAGSLKTAIFLEDSGAIPLGWRIYVGGEFKEEIPQKLLNMLGVRVRGDEIELLVGPKAFAFVEMFHFKQRSSGVLFFQPKCGGIVLGTFFVYCIDF